jgi:hypothetical protein
MNYKILDAKWWTPPLPGFSVLRQAAVGGTKLAIGIVAIESYDPGNGLPVQWKCYVGYGRGEDEEADMQAIARHGMPFGSQEAACGLFPELDPEGYRS